MVCSRREAGPSVCGKGEPWESSCPQRNAHRAENSQDQREASYGDGHWAMSAGDLKGIGKKACEGDHRLKVPRSAQLP